MIVVLHILLPFAIVELPKVLDPFQDPPQDHDLEFIIGSLRDL